MNKILKKRLVYILIALTLLIQNVFCQQPIKYKQIQFYPQKKQQVEVLKQKYITTHKNWLYDVLDQAEFYRVYVRNEIKKRNMPAILEYLPVVESNYLPTARSKSGATGMWQFMLNSVKPFLICNEYIDERLDPFKSTQAALTKLQDNYNMFGDWLLAITAYNCGAGAMKRALKKAEKKDLWYLIEHNMLSKQASEYVPKLLAIADVATNHKYYKITLPTANDIYGNTLKLPVDDFEFVTVKQEINLSWLAHELRIDYETLKNLNLALIKGSTPPNQKYSIRVPYGMKKTVEYVLNQHY